MSKRIPRTGFTPAQEPAIRYIEQNLVGGTAASGSDDIPSSRSKTDTTVTDPIGGGSATAASYATAGSAIELQVDGDAYPQVVIPADGDTGIYMGDGTIDPTNGLNVFYYSGTSYFTGSGSGDVQLTSQNGILVEATLGDLALTTPYANEVKVTSGHITSPNGGSGAEQFGHAAAAANTSTAVGNTAVANDIRSVVIGNNAKAEQESVVIGYNADASGGAGDDFIVVIGSQAGVTTGNAGGSVIIGSPATVGNSGYNVVIGNLAQVGNLSVNAIAIGQSSRVRDNSQNSIAIGGSDVQAANSIGVGTNLGTQIFNSGSTNSIAIGTAYGTVGSNTGKIATKSIAIDGAVGVSNNTDRGIAIGYGSLAEHDYTTAVGVESQAKQSGAVALGWNAIANNSDEVIIGQSAASTAQTLITFGHVVIGKGASTGGGNLSTAVVIGRSAIAPNPSANTGAVAIGDSASATGGIAIGLGATSAISGGVLTYGSPIAIGDNTTTAKGTGSIAVGYDAQSKTAGGAAVSAAIAIGATSRAKIDSAIAIGKNAVVTSDSSIGLGVNASVSGSLATALGITATASGSHSVAIGNSVTASNTGSIAIGDSVTASAANEIVIGQVKITPGTPSNGQALVYNSGTGHYTPTTVSGSGGDANYVHVQAGASTSWAVAHSLGKFPCVAVVDGSNNEIEGEVSYVDANNLTVAFNSAVSGKAYVN